MKLKDGLKLVAEKLALAGTKTDFTDRWYVEQEIDRLFDHRFLDGFEIIGMGRHRVCYAKPKSKYVLKIPRNVAGCDANVSEATFYADRKRFADSQDRMARCRLVMIEKVPCILMERINRDNGSSRWPDWVYFVDCQQVGLDRKGRLVAYDFADARP